MALRVENYRPENRATTTLAPEREARATPSSTGASTSTARDSVEIALENRVRADFERTFGAQARDKDAFHDTMKKVYGEGYDSERAEELRQKAIAGDFSWLPPIQWSNSAELGGEGAAGAYDAKSGKIFLNKDLANDPQLLSDTFLEEVGHHMDTRLNAADTMGDEGEMFRRVMKGEALSAEQVQEIRAENDKGTIQVGGRTVEVEYNFLKKIGKAIGGAVKSVGKAVGGAVKGVVEGVKDVAKGVAKGIGSVVKTIGEGLSKIGGPLLKALDFLSPALLLIPGAGPGLYAAYNIAKTAIAAANGDWKSALFSGLGALTGVGGAVGKVAGMAEKGLQFFEAAKRVAKGDTAGILDALGAASGFAGGAGLGKVAAGLDDAARFGKIGLGVVQGAKNGDIGEIIGGVAAGAGLAGKRGYLDPAVADRIQHIAGLAGDGAEAFQALARGDAIGALDNLQGVIGGLAGPMGQENVDRLQQILGYGKNGVAAYDAIRRGDAFGALDQFRQVLDAAQIDPGKWLDGVLGTNGIGQFGSDALALAKAVGAQDFDGAFGAARRIAEAGGIDLSKLAPYGFDAASVMRFVDAGRNLGRANAIGDGAAMLRQVELMLGLGGTHLGRMFGMRPAALRDAFDQVSPLALRLSEAARTGDPIRLIEAVRNAANAAGFDQNTRYRVDAGLGLAISGAQAYGALQRGDFGGFAQALDLPALLAGARTRRDLPSSQFAAPQLRDRLASFGMGGESGESQLTALLGRLSQDPQLGPAVSQIYTRLAPWLGGGEMVFRAIREGRYGVAIQILTRIAEQNGAVLPDTNLAA